MGAVATYLLMESPWRWQPVPLPTRAVESLEESSSTSSSGPESVVDEPIFRTTLTGLRPSVKILMASSVVLVLSKFRECFQ
jgi:hypothetical protein